MRRFLAVLAGATVLSATAAFAQEETADEVEAPLFEAGQEIYQTNCAHCHQSDGSGTLPAFPALSGNEALEDLELVVTIIHEGRGAMPSFSHFDLEEMTAISTYIRNAWGNEFGPVEVEEVAEILGEELDAEDGTGDTDEAAPSADGPISSWDGVYTEEQAARGQTAYAGACAMCHGARLDGAAGDPDMQSAPPLARYAFLRNWDGRSVGAVFDYSRTTMPEQNPGSLSDQQYIDIVAHMLSVSGMPAGEEELPPEPSVLANIRIDQEQP